MKNVYQLRHAEQISSTRTVNNLATRTCDQLLWKQVVRSVCFKPTDEPCTLIHTRTNRGLANCNLMALSRTLSCASFSNTCTSVRLCIAAKITSWPQNSPIKPSAQKVNKPWFSETRAYCSLAVHGHATPAELQLVTTLRCSTCTSRRKPVSFPNHVRMRLQTKPQNWTWEWDNKSENSRIQNEAVWQGSEENIYNSQQCQKSASRVNTCSFVSDMTPLFWYSPTRFSKKFVFPSREMFSIKSNGFSTL